MEFSTPVAPGTAAYDGRESQVFPRFYQWQKPQTYLSQQEGRPITKSMDMVEIMQAGQRECTVKEEVNMLHKQRWPRQWADYQAGREQVLTGTPLAVLFPANEEIVSELKRHHIHTVEALSGAPDTINLMGFVEWRKRAVQFLAHSEKGKGFHELDSKMKQAETENRELKERLAALEAKLAKQGKAA